MRPWTLIFAFVSDASSQILPCRLMEKGDLRNALRQDGDGELLWYKK